MGQARAREVHTACGDVDMHAKAMHGKFGMHAMEGKGRTGRRCEARLGAENHSVRREEAGNGESECEIRV